MTPPPAPAPDMPQLCVVMPVFNGERFLTQALDSILNQSVTAFQFIIINDGSTDSTADILRDYARRDSRIELLTQENRGLAVSLNRGCAQASAPIIARMDCDDIAYPQRFATQLRFLQEHPRVAVVGTMARFIGEDVNHCNYVPQYPAHPLQVAEALGHNNVLIHASVMMRKSAVEQAGGYRLAVVPSEDYDLWLRISQRHELANVPQVLMDYRLHTHRASARMLDRQILGAFAARLAAKRRRAGQSENLSDLQQVTRADLVALGASQVQIDNAFVEGYAQAASMMFAVGADEAAMGLIDQARQIKWSDHARRRLRAERAWLQTKIHLRARRPIAAGGNLLLACARRPALLGKLMARL